MDDVTVARLKEEIDIIKLHIKEILIRNKQKDQGKDFEGSYTRIIFIMIITYLTLFGYMTLIDTPNSALNAIVPTIGFNLSTWSLPYVKQIWIKCYNRKEEMEQDSPA